MMTKRTKAIEPKPLAARAGLVPVKRKSLRSKLPASWHEMTWRRRLMAEIPITQPDARFVRRAPT